MIMTKIINISMMIMIMTKIFIISIMIMLGLPVTVDDVEVDAVVGQPARLAAVVAQPSFGFVFISICICLCTKKSIPF